MNKEKKDLTVEFTPQVEQQMAEDPKLAEALRDFIAVLHQAKDGVERGQYKTMDDAIESITGNRPMKLDAETGEEIVGGLMHDEVFPDDSEQS